jgi:hypothetical protein
MMYSRRGCIVLFDIGDGYAGELLAVARFDRAVSVIRAGCETFGRNPVRGSGDPRTTGQGNPSTVLGSTLLTAGRVNRGVPPVYVKLPNKANFPWCLNLRIGLMDKVLEVEVRQCVTWLRFAKMASFLGSGRRERLTKLAFRSRTL